MEKISIKAALRLSILIIVFGWIGTLIINIFFYKQIQHILINTTAHFIVFIFLYGMLTIFVFSFLLYLSNEKYKDIGFHKKAILKQVSFGTAFGLLIFVLQSIIVSPIIYALLPKGLPEGIENDGLFENIHYLPFWIFIAVFFGPFVEEFSRIFMLTRFEKCFGKFGLLLAVIIGSIVFGIGHFYEGFGSIISIGIGGTLFALIYLRKRLALEPIVAHATFNLVGIIIGAIMHC